RFVFHTSLPLPLLSGTSERGRGTQHAFLPLLKQAASRGGPGMSIQRQAVINMAALLGSVELNWGDRSNNIKWYPYRTSKVLHQWTSRPEGILCMVIYPSWVRTDMGGAEASLSAEESVSSLLSVIGGQTEKDHGSFLNFTGEILPW
uniref:Uncharacterized protein n=1 Tax=Gasterosteus aculeatus aculeatus TaxID=481459 RepID=A0AAQ4S1D3_GASAC